MSLSVETGSGLSNADSYLSVVDCDTYHTNHSASTVWSGASTSVKEKALRLATQYIDTHYKTRFAGSRVYPTQALSFPRAGIIDYDGFPILPNSVPQVLKDAVAELALRSVIGDVLLPDLPAGGGAVTSESKTLDTLSKSTTYAGTKREVVKYSIVDKLLTDLVNQPGYLERA